MSKMTLVLRTCGLILICVTTVISVENIESEPWIVSYNVDAKSCFESTCKYLVNLGGSEYLGHFSIRLTPEKGARGAACDIIYPSYELREVLTTKWQSAVNITVPKVEGKFYFCLLQNKIPNVSFGGKWVHQGEEFYLDPLHDRVSYNVQMNTETAEGTNNLTQNEYNTQRADLLQREEEEEWADLTHDTDVNYLPGVNRPTREEATQIEVMLGDTYVPLGDILDKELELVEVVGIERDRGDNNELRNGETSEIVNREEDEEERNVTGELEMNKNNTQDKEMNLEFDSLSGGESNLKGKLERTKRDALDSPKVNASVKIISVLQIEGLRVEYADKTHIVDGVPSVLAHSEVVLRLFGHGLSNRTVIAFTYEELNFGEPCKFLVKDEYMVQQDTLTDYSALFEITAPPAQETNARLYICAKQLEGSLDATSDRSKFYHQGSEPYKAFTTHTPLLPLWFSLSLIVVCLCFSALFSGLNLGLMSLDRTELKIIANTGTEEEKGYARAIMPVRDHGNYLLCSILLGNVAVNSTFTILLDELTSGLLAIILSTISIVLLGEITPQAICSRHGLKIGAKSIMITKAVMGITAPLAYPVSKLLDYFLGEEIGNVYNRERLKELVKVTTGVNDLDKDEVNIISGALELRKKMVSEVMTKLEDIFMLPIDSVLDFETMSEIIKSGFSRIPVYEANRNNIITVLFIKDLAFVDPDDNTPLRTLCQYYQNPCNFVFEDVTLDVMFKQFKEGHKGHMAFVHRINNEGEGDPFYETIGLVTLEDVIEELIQAEIVDETDVFMDNRSKRRRNKPQNKLQDFLAFAERHENQLIHISPQLTLATFQFLSTSVEAFKPDLVSENVLRRLLKQDVIQHIKVKAKDKKDPSTYVFQQGKSVDYFVLILEGRVEVTVGRENLVFESGPFTYFGIQALMQNVGVAESPSPSAMGSLQNINMDSILRHSFVPDYSVRAISEVFYLTVKRSLYLAAKRATLMERGVLSKGQSTNEQFDTEVDKLFQSAEEELSIGDQKTPSRQISPNPMPASCSAITKAVFTSPRSPEPRNGSVQRDSIEEQEKLIPPIT